MKRILDIVFSLTGLLFLSPLFIIIGALVLLRLGRPVFFIQTRPGRYGEPFKIIKFRSMTNVTDNDGNLLPNANRLTSFGFFLRSSSLDELPALINVLSGKMSMVGPRPLLMDYLPLYNEFQRRRNQVKPGITGWAQVNGRNALTWDDKFKFDVWYVENQSFRLDLKIIGLTVFKVLKREGITHDGDAAMPRFRGNSHVSEKQ